MMESTETKPLLSNKSNKAQQKDDQKFESIALTINGESKHPNPQKMVEKNLVELEEYSENKYLDEQKQEINFSDPFLQQLSKDLLKFVVTPSNQKIPYVTRSDSNKVARGFLTAALLPYAALKSVLVREGEICLTWNGDTPEFLGPGRHVLFKPTNTVSEIKSLRDNPIIQHGTFSIIRVSMGQLGYALDGTSGKPKFLSPGTHVINSQTFKFIKFLDLAAPINDLDIFKLIRVETGNVGICYSNTGKLKILDPGVHLIIPPDRFEGFESTQQQILPLPEAEFESSDYVTLLINSDVFYKIEDPKKAYTNVKSIKKAITDVAVATLSNIIRSSTLAEIGQSSKQSYKKTDQNIKHNKKEDDFLPSAPSFYTRVHDEFIHELHDHYLDAWGISIDNIRIETLKIKDEKFAKDISGQAVTYAKVQTELSNAQFQNQIQAAASERDANTIRVKAEAESLATERKAQANANALLKEAEAKSQALILEAKARAQAIELTSKAEFNAAKLRAESRSFYAQKMKEVGSVGEQLALYDAQAAAFGNVQKMLYLPQNTLPTLFNDYRVRIPTIHEEDLSGKFSQEIDNTANSIQQANV